MTTFKQHLSLRETSNHRSRFLSLSLRLLCVVDTRLVVVVVVEHKNVPVPSRPRRFRDGRVDDLPRAFERADFPLVFSPPPSCPMPRCRPDVFFVVARVFVRRPSRRRRRRRRGCCPPLFFFRAVVGSGGGVSIHRGVKRVPKPLARVHLAVAVILRQLESRRCCCLFVCRSFQR